MKSKLPPEIKQAIREDAAASKQTRWEIIGECGMDTAGLLIADPCYVMHQEGRDPATLEINDYKKWIVSKEEVTKLKFKRGHEGAGLIVHSPHGDGCVSIWGKLDAKNRVRSVFFSFDGETPNNLPAA